MNEIPVPIREIATYGAAVAQSTREDILTNAGWAHAGGDEVIVIEKLGIFGATTATFGLYKGRDIISEEGSACDTTSFGGNWDNVPTVMISLLPNQSLRLFMTDSAADPAGLTLAVKGAAFKVAEL